jgi:hypothetical protein
MLDRNDLKKDQEIEDEIGALRRLGTMCANDPLARASIAGQINVLEWVLIRRGLSKIMKVA